MRDMSRNCLVWPTAAQFAGKRGGNVNRYEQMMRDNRRRQEQRERDFRISGELNRRDNQLEARANERASRQIDAENRRHRERMALERKRDRRESLRRQGFTEGEIAELERSDAWRSIRNTLLGVVFVGACVVGLVWIFKTYGAAELEPIDQYLRAESRNGEGDASLAFDEEINPDPMIDNYSDEADGRPELEIEQTNTLPANEDSQATIDYEGIRKAREDRASGLKDAAIVRVPFNSPKLIDKTEEALNRGEAVRWRAEGETGYVLVSGPRLTGDTECRQVSVSIIDDGAQPVSPATEYCRETGGNWFSR